MLTEKQKLEIAEEFLKEFTTLLKTFLIKMDLPFTPVTMLRYNSNWQKKLNLAEMISIVDLDIKAKQPDTYPEGLRTKSRRRELVLRRQILYKMGRTAGLTFEQIAIEFGMDHASVIHGVKVVNALGDTADKEVAKVTMEIEDLIKLYYFEKYGKDISDSDEAGNNT